MSEGFWQRKNVCQVIFNEKWFTLIGFWSLYTLITWKNENLMILLLHNIQITCLVEINEISNFFNNFLSDELSRFIYYYYHWKLDQSKYNLFHD